MSVGAGEVGGVAEQPLNVHLTNAGPTLVEILGPAAIVLAALAGAWFAARYARQNVQRELAAAEVRLKIQMQHDRRVRDRQATRGVLDDVVKTIEEIIDADATFMVEVDRVERLRDEVGEAPPDSSWRKDAEERLERLTKDDLQRSFSEAADAVVRAHPARMRLRLRFADDHPIICTFTDWHRIMNQIYELSRKGIAVNRTSDDVRETEELADKVDPALDEFAAAVRDWMNAVDVEDLNESRP